ncbi:MAG: hypothetical protein UY31_C0003G0009 [Candidatus Wolfebacteria bacterium GW2011_GWE1_48_7]|uniref:Uncharacterized protein n=2 Tax=Candidatus Wolfeibacteriota TaxID=1752735 RepID=A0A0G1X3U1_9BACT|nr:MAG: hypothetical protein UX70_C0001G0891 [Candidatus Wolfebacteria bacterium GW2011_GWB1_47_1]KKU34449.1 MAG: hypothetical protein UX49_C0046G0001 [Candidatus Wolfebacteria bacterium GW2011_GWC2_46_275]KKU42178.1 MAG: hypothetical protein UX58_C0003G0102 [Candidatus Wolfebacteria bacterium GW2011_GWB2_46_69]KKU54046.1 MAG: hypothetical protein UX76_C0006G0012 [Candidatus Wolfebacteria bacterium GW2011_GWC1_47_103]KKU59233.1 MAG: hypothetical protein UX83_C0006G0003 [Candidatus Wolfebacteria
MEKIREDAMVERDMIEEFKRLIAIEVKLQAEIERNKQAIEMLVCDEMYLKDVARFYSTIKVYSVWEKGDLNVSLVTSKSGKLRSCGVLLWGCPIGIDLGQLAIKVHEFRARFLVFDGDPSGRSFPQINSCGGSERQKFIESINNLCKAVGISRVFAKNAKLLESGGMLSCMTEEIVNFYMLIARPDGTLLPEFDFIDPQKSSAFWSNNG